MTQNLNDEIERELEKLDNEFGFSAMDGAIDELRKSFLLIAKKTVEAVRVENDKETLGDIARHSKKAKEWLGDI